MAIQIPANKDKHLRRLRPVEQDDNAQHVRLLVDTQVGKDVYVVGMGSSLYGFDFARLDGLLTIALNDAVKQPGYTPSYHLFSDGNLVRRKRPEASQGNGHISGGYIDLAYAPKTLVICQRNARKQFLQSGQPLDLKRRVYQFALTQDLARTKREDSDLYVSHTVATAAIHLAWKLGAARCFLLGVDGYKRRESGREVYYANGLPKPPERRREKIDDMDGWQRVMQDRHEFWQKEHQNLADKLAKDKATLEVFNASEHSTINSWPKISLDEALDGKD